MKFWQSKCRERSAFEESCIRQFPKWKNETKRNNRMNDRIDRMNIHNINSIGRKRMGYYRKYMLFIRFTEFSSD